MTAKEALYKLERAVNTLGITTITHYYKCDLCSIYHRPSTVLMVTV